LKLTFLLLMPETSDGLFSSFSSTLPASYANRRIIVEHCGMLTAEGLSGVSCFLAYDVVHTPSCEATSSEIWKDRPVSLPLLPCRFYTRQRELCLYNEHQGMSSSAFSITSSSISKAHFLCVPRTFSTTLIAASRPPKRPFHRPV
jgi:hypothetical protein